MSEASLRPRARDGLSFWQRQSVRARLADAASYLLLGALSALFLVPFLWALSGSVKKLDGFYAYPPTFLPRVFHWENYVKAVTILPFPLFFANSLFVTLASVLGQLLSGSLVAYSFARLRWPGRDFFFVVLLSTMMLPAQVTIIPQFILWSRLPGWTGLPVGIGTFWPLVLPAFLGGGPVFIFLMRQFFKTIPVEIEDAARIDGCSTFGIYWRLMLPLSRPVLATVAVLAFIQHWHDFLGPLIYLDSVDRYTLQLGLRMFQNMYGGFAHYLMAASMLVLLPVLILFFAAQRYFVRGIVLSGIKG
jgi:multiple sugar transport system permease protein